MKKIIFIVIFFIIGIYQTNGYYYPINLQTNKYINCNDDNAKRWCDEVLNLGNDEFGFYNCSTDTREDISYYDGNAWQDIIGQSSYMLSLTCKKDLIKSVDDVVGNGFVWTDILFYGPIGGIVIIFLSFTLIGIVLIFIKKVIKHK